MLELGHKEGWAPKNWCFQNVVLERTLESSLVSKEIKPVNPKGSQHWIFFGRTDAEAEAPVLWKPDAKSQLIGKGPEKGYWERLREKGVTEDEMAEWHHWLNGHEFEQTPGNSEGQGSLTCCSPLWSQGVGHDLATEQQQEHNWNSLSWLASKKLNYRVRTVLTLVKWLSLVKLTFNKS